MLHEAHAAFWAAVRTLAQTDAPLLERLVAAHRDSIANVRTREEDLPTEEDYPDLRPNFRELRRRLNALAEMPEVARYGKFMVISQTPVAPDLAKECRQLAKLLCDVHANLTCARLAEEREKEPFRGGLDDDEIPPPIEELLANADKDGKEGK
jgi:hypothetical protein